MGFLDGDLLYPESKDESQKHKLKRLVQGPKSFFMDVKCPSCYEITPVFSHASSVVICPSCSSVRLSFARVYEASFTIPVHFFSHPTADSRQPDRRQGSPDVPHVLPQEAHRLIVYNAMF